MRKADLREMSELFGGRVVAEVGALKRLVRLLSHPLAVFERVGMRAEEVRPQIFQRETVRNDFRAKLKKLVHSSLRAGLDNRTIAEAGGESIAPGGGLFA
ncbi:hypothetical protein [Sphingomonas sp. ABOLF]|uniref:hypothetical protein n=1 Tax=Sphingomonas sp. ABOLF TaxID=1985879 RepID=UPI000F7E1990|nr:hypothetical protein [Sphingomonas sp. ABOLF]